MPREGQKQATEVARMARQHKEKEPNHRKVSGFLFFMVARPNDQIFESELRGSLLKESRVLNQNFVFSVY